MPIEKTFFASVYYNGFVYTFGGYDAYDKEQLSDCAYFDTVRNQWHNNALLNPQGKTEF
jgi:N-acetylneuraminic acid mutarotase